MDTVIRYNSDGEIISSDVIGTNDAIKYVRPPKEGSKEKHYKKNEEQIGIMSQELGGFYFMLYFENKELFDGRIDEKHISRLIYLATYLDYESNRLVERKGRSNEILVEKDIKAKLKLDKKTYRTFIDEVVAKNLLMFRNDGIYLSERFFCKGKCPRDGRQFSRVYISTVRQLYTQISPRQHKTLSYLFKLLPYCDFEYNVITKHPNQEDAMKYRMNKTDVAEILNIDYKAYINIEKALENLEITIMGEEYYVLCSVSVRCGKEKKDFYAVNPLLFNSGNEIDKLQSIWTQMLKK